MSAPVIPKEHLSAYQRWEMTSFGDQRPSVARSSEALEAAARKAAEETARAAAEAAAIAREEARREGYAQGQAEGHAEGHAAGMQAGLTEGRAAAAQEVEQLQRVAAAFTDEAARAGEAVAQDMLTLALDIAKAMLKTALDVRPELVLPVVADAIRYLPTVQLPAQLVLHPLDSAIVRENMEGELAASGWRIVEDAQMIRGGCRVETASNQIDATTPVRWQRIAEALGRQSDWLE